MRMVCIIVQIDVATAAIAVAAAQQYNSRSDAVTTPGSSGSTHLAAHKQQQQQQQVAEWETITAAKTNISHFVQPYQVYDNGASTAILYGTFMI